MCVFVFVSYSCKDFGSFSSRDTMVAHLVCVVVVLCLTSVSGQEEEGIVLCEDACRRYQDYGEKCVVESGCPQMTADAKQACHEDCLSHFQQCQTLCHQHYDLLNNICAEKCKNASIMDVFCEVECFGDELASQYMKGVPELVPAQVIEIVQGGPLLSEEGEMAQKESVSSEEGDVNSVEEDRSVDELFVEIEHDLSQEEVSAKDDSSDHFDVEGLA